MLSFVVCLMTFFSFANPQPATKQEKKILKPERKTNEPVTKKKRDPEIESLVAEVQSLPPEFASDFLIRIATSDQVKEKEWKLELLEDAFRIASKVQYQYKRTGIRRIHTDTRTGMMNRSHQENMDAVTLKCRVVQATLVLDAQKALELFEQIPAIKLPTLTCKDSLVYDVAAYYGTLYEVAEKAFSPEQIKREENIFFISSRISTIDSAVQITPIARTIEELTLTRSQIYTLVSSFVSALKKIDSDDRSFSDSIGWIGQSITITKLLKKCESAELSGTELLSTYRLFLVNHLNNTRCADSIKFDDQHTVQAYVSLNERMKERIEFKQITAEEIKSVKTEGKAEVFEFWQSSEAKPFLLKMKQLNFGIGIPPNITGNEELTIEERTAIKWRKQLHDFLQDFRLWRSDAEKSESDYFHQKAIILSGLIDLTPPDISHDSVLREYVNFLCESSMQRDNPIEWYYHVKRFITYIAKPNTPDYDVALEMMKSCGSPTMNVIAKMEKMFPK